jgi:endonuclease I
MKRTILLVQLVIAIAANVYAGTVPPDSTIFPGQTGATLIASLISAYKSTTNLGYDAGRDTMYGVIDKLNDSLECVYCGYKIWMDPTQDPSTWAYDNDINCEHSWPQSLLSSSTAEGDLHHLFPTETQVNGDRGNYPFAEINDASTTYWYYNNNRTTSIPSSNIDLYAECLSGVSFEPREQQKGNTARAMYYVLTMWQQADTNDAWWTGQRDILYTWHVNDPADAREIIRTKKIATYQNGKVNPFVLDSTLIRRAYFPTLPTNTSVSFSPTSATKIESAGNCSLKVAIISPSGTIATTVQVVLTGGTGTAADINNYTTQTLTFPAGSSATQSAVLTITDDVLDEGTETLIFTLRNASGGTSAKVGSDSIFTLTITDNDDAIAPVITSGPSVTGISSNSATVNWSTDEASNSWVYYGLTTSYSDTAKNESDVISHSVGLSGLAASTIYHYKVSSTDPMDNGPTYSSDNTFTTSASSGFTVVISEVNEQRSSLPLYYNEYVELYNNTAVSIALNNWQLRQDNTAYVTTFGSADTIKAYGYFVIVRTSTGSWSTYYSVPYNVVGSLVLNGGETFSLRDAGNNLIDSTITFGASYYCQYRAWPFADGTLPASWYGDAANATSATYGTPGGANPNDPLGVEMASFTALGEPGQISLKWTTASEINSYQWEVWRSLDSSGDYHKIATLFTLGTSNEVHDYSWVDKDIICPMIYYYKLIEKDLNEDSTVYGPVSAKALPIYTEDYQKAQVVCWPNPFNDRISFRYILSKSCQLKVEIYNISGQLVRSLAVAGNVGQNQIFWNGRTDEGKSCPAGIYFYRSSVDGDINRGKIILVR